MFILFSDRACGASGPWRHAPLSELQWIGVEALESGATRRSAATFSSRFISSSSTGPIRTVWSQTRSHWMLGTAQSSSQQNRTGRFCVIFAVKPRRVSSRALLSPTHLHHQISFRTDYWPLAVSWSACSCARTGEYLHTCISEDCSAWNKPWWWWWWCACGVLQFMQAWFSTS